MAEEEDLDPIVQSVRISQRAQMNCRPMRCKPSRRFICSSVITWGSHAPVKTVGYARCFTVNRLYQQLAQKLRLNLRIYQGPEPQKRQPLRRVQRDQRVQNQKQRPDKQHRPSKNIYQAEASARRRHRQIRQKRLYWLRNSFKDSTECLRGSRTPPDCVLQWAAQWARASGRVRCSCRTSAARSGR